MLRELLERAGLSFVGDDCWGGVGLPTSVSSALADKLGVDGLWELADGLPAPEPSSDPNPVGVRSGRRILPGASGPPSA